MMGARIKKKAVRQKKQAGGGELKTINRLSLRLVEASEGQGKGRKFIWKVKSVGAAAVKNSSEQSEMAMHIKTRLLADGLSKTPKGN